MNEVIQNTSEEDLEDIGINIDVKLKAEDVKPIKLQVKFVPNEKEKALIEKLNNLVKKTSARNYKELGKSSIKMDIELTDSTPIFKHPYKRSEVETAITEKMLDELRCRSD